MRVENLKKTFEMLKKEYGKEDLLRDELIRRSRVVVKLSKRIIYSVHRNDLKSASEAITKIKKEVAKIKSLTKSKVSDVGYLRNAFQEYVEAICFYEFIKNKKIPTNKNLGVDVDSYLLGICDLTGELMRYATNNFINKRFNIVVEVRDLMNFVYDELMLFDFRSGELRNKFDSIKYSVKKLNDLVIDIMKLEDKK